MENTKHTLYWVWLASIQGMTARRFYRMVDRFEDALGVWEHASADCEDFMDTAGPLADTIIAHRNEPCVETLFADMQKIGCRALPMFDNEYPKLLREISDPPPVLFVKGGRIDYPRAISVVGSRRFDRVGEDTAVKIGQELSDAGICVVSGMAEGIDSCAHNGALKGKTPTVAVFGCGVDVIYPRYNQELYARILDQNGAIVSEYPPKTGVARAHFPVRNRIISGMSRAVVVVQAPQKSGAMITVRHALEQGRDVFSVPGSILSRYYEGTNQLLKEGAFLYTQLCDILGEYGWEDIQQPDSAVDSAPFELNDGEKLVYSILEKGEYTYEELIIHTNMDAQTLSPLLSHMELKGLIIRSAGNIFGIMHR
ncbi:MAG: DNA-processing protein DprA [Christensenellales bacterium]|jgi:DNA processing protein